MPVEMLEKLFWIILLQLLYHIALLFLILVFEFFLEFLVITLALFNLVNAILLWCLLNSSKAFKYFLYRSSQLRLNHGLFSAILFAVGACFTFTLQYFPSTLLRFSLKSSIIWFISVPSTTQE